MTRKTWRQLTVWLHVLTAVGWMTQALALLSLLALALADPVQRPAAMAMAARLDWTVLAQLANIAAFTGLMLSAATPWGFVKHWWVAVKFAITLPLLNICAVVLAPLIRDGQAPGLLAATAVVLAVALGYQTWLSVAKPWGRTRWYSMQETAPAWVFAATIVVAFADMAIGYAVSFPTPTISLLFLLGYVAYAAIQRRSTARVNPLATSSTTWRAAR
ncbi:hypothetical protein [Kutzneria buriramensis]|uniref:Uncharacterized protein n=1 Tax=Kutzneria buriramensis TaxID=1045776 RepID=A0A3E0HAX7_9PSEU|nr:hypothetical protein [Kutzneria buriramensis]REH41209.1 hypothetical protein BCF44_112293 [Kutzneria buriramensis]